MKEIVNDEYNISPLGYQISEYDCGTVTMLNAIRYFLHTQDTTPDFYKHIVNSTLDVTNELGEMGKGGTSTKALVDLCEWIDKDSFNEHIAIRYKNLPKDEISIYNTELEDKINNGAVAILRTYLDCEHYCLLTGMDEKYAYVFDPYYLYDNYCDNDTEVDIIKDRPFEYNRRITKERMNENSSKDFSLVKSDNAQILIIESIEIK